MSTEDTALTMRITFKPGMPAVEKAKAAFEARLAFMDLIDSLVDEAGAMGKVRWDVREQVFDGDDADAGPIFDAMMFAYQKGLDTALSSIGEGEA